MKKALLFTAVLFFQSFSWAAGSWQRIGSENLWSSAPSYFEFPIRDQQTYSEVRIVVERGAVRVQNALLIKPDMTQIPLWNLQGDWGSPRSAEMRFSPTSLRALRFHVMSLQNNVSARIQVYIR
ncbi:MAG: hypothetical protein AAGB31_13880 [Bdellovibrio sp.]